jgi:hypothetical protein
MRRREGEDIVGTQQALEHLRDHVGTYQARVDERRRERQHGLVSPGAAVRLRSARKDD